MPSSPAKQHPQTLHNPTHETRRRPANPRRTTQKPPRCSPSSNLPHANKLLQLSFQSNYWMYSIWWPVLLWSRISRIPVVRMASGYCCAGFGVWVFACGCEAGSQICNSVPVYVSWDQWRGTFDLGYREEFSKEADCCAGVDDFGIEFCECSIFGYLGVIGILQRIIINDQLQFSLSCSTSARIVGLLSCSVNPSPRYPGAFPNSLRSLKLFRSFDPTTFEAFLKYGDGNLTRVS